MPQYENSQPIFQPVKPVSTAQGHEAFAQALSKLSEKSGDMAISMANEESNAMFTSSVSNIEQIKTTSLERMLEHPDQSQKIASDMDDAAQMVKEVSFVNSKDRSKLNTYIDGTMNDVNLKATEMSVNQSRLAASYTHYANWPSQLKAYQDALISDPEAADTLHDAMLQSLKSLVMTRSITPEQAGSSIQTMQSVVGIADDHHQMYGNSEATAQDYHSVSSSPLNGSLENAGKPINGNTQWMIDYHNNDASFQGVLSDISNKSLPNPAVFDSLSAHQRQRAILSMQGVREADGMINSGATFPEIKAAAERLGQKGQVLDYKQQFTRNALNNYVTKLQNGDYLDVVGSTPSGGQIMQGFVNRNSSIQRAAMDNDQKSQAMMQNKNQLVNESVAYGQAHDIPANYIQPIPKQDVANAQNSFVAGQDPNVALSTMKQYSKQNQMYFANAMKSPDQRMILQAISYAPNIKPADQQDFIAANQSGRTYENQEVLNPSITNNVLTNRINNNLKGAMSVVGEQYDFVNAQTLQKSMTTTTMKYAKYLAAKNNDIGMNHWKDYVDQASAIYSGGFSKMTGTNYSINTNQLPIPMTSSELDTLANYVTNKGYDYLSNGQSSAMVISQQRNPLRMVLTPHNEVQAIDSNNKIYYTHPLTTDLMSTAAKDAEMRNKKTQAKSSIYEGIVKQQLNVR